MLRREEHRRDRPRRIRNTSLTEFGAPSPSMATPRSAWSSLIPTREPVEQQPEGPLTTRPDGAGRVAFADRVSPHDEPSASRSRWTVLRSPFAMNASPAHTRSLAARYTSAHGASNHRISSGNSTPSGTPGHGSRTTQPQSSVSYHTAGSTPARSRRLRRARRALRGRRP